MGASPTPQATPSPITDLRGKIGQMLLVGFRGLTVAEAPTIAADIRDRGLGGVLLSTGTCPAGRRSATSILSRGWSAPATSARPGSPSPSPGSRLSRPDGASNSLPRGITPRAGTPAGHNAHGVRVLPSGSAIQQEWRRTPPHVRIRALAARSATL